MATASQDIVRARILMALSSGAAVCAETISDIRGQLGLRDFTNKEVRRAIEALHYGPEKRIGLYRPVLREGLSRGWKIRSVA